ncbi:hypothetical protein [Noviherbaspirillum massiliense]|uniref:hypothetical protein n=1 Tax=Noviherbaspirillum massiliense TaxID=1465823 RepID=UPI0003136513|nr:hypothetical protein [Noviherbaspirillum massiliense]
MLKICTAVLGLVVMSFAAADEFEDYAQVTKVTPRVEEVNQPQQECRLNTVAGHAMRQCRTVDQWLTRANGYAVTYEYHGHSYTSVIPYDPGNRLRIRVSISPDM